MKIEIVDDNEEGSAGRITEVEEGLEVDTCYICNRLAKLFFGLFNSYRIGFQDFGAIFTRF